LNTDKKPFSIIHKSAKQLSMNASTDKLTDSFIIMNHIPNMYQEGHRAKAT